MSAKVLKVADDGPGENTNMPAVLFSNGYLLLGHLMHLRWEINQHAHTKATYFLYTEFNYSIRKSTMSREQYIYNAVTGFQWTFSRFVSLVPIR